ncbi:hypothetical protein LguiA_035615 [Lonicera macranthoides]
MVWPGVTEGRKMNCFSCYISQDKFGKRSLKKSIREYKDARTLASMTNISFGNECIRRFRSTGNANLSSEVFTYKELCASTQNFSFDCMIGEGGFGRVYKGYLESKNMEVAIKALDKNGFQGNREFLVEVLMLNLLHHTNLVKLVGYCVEDDQRVLVYEYMRNGSLEDHLHGNKKPLDWNTRMKIAKGAAKGLEYLHQTAYPPVIYRDFKASNILLDEKFNPKLSDFGMAKLGPTDGMTHVSTRVMGTYGYCAPEYALTGHLTTKSDVYSFGVVFLELISGRKVFDSSRKLEEQNLIPWAQKLMRNKKRFHLVADPLLEGNYPLKGLYQALAVADMCVQEEANARPLISDVVIALEYLCDDMPSSGSPKRICAEDVRNNNGGYKSG